MKRLVLILALAIPAALYAQQDVWLTPERAALLKRVTSRPYITKRVTINSRTVAVHWSNGAREWVTTNELFCLAGAKAVNAWQSKVDAARAEKEAVLSDLKTLAAKPTISKKDIEAVIGKANEKGSVFIGKTEKGGL